MSLQKWRGIFPAVKDKLRMIADAVQLPLMVYNKVVETLIGVGNEYVRHPH